MASEKKIFNDFPIQSTLDTSKLWGLFFTSSNYPKCKLIFGIARVDCTSQCKSDKPWGGAIFGPGVIGEIAMTAAQLLDDKPLTGINIITDARHC